MRRKLVLALTLGLTLLAPTLLGVGDDPGVLLRVDRKHFELESIDLASRSAGPTLLVVLGSPAHPTPPGEFHPSRVVRNPRWVPGAAARAHGAVPLPPSSDGPLGIGKIPLDDEGIQIHGGAHPLELGKPLSLGCVRVLDTSWTDLVNWLEARNALAPWQVASDGERVSVFRRPVRVIVY